jgi:hypothetical protein
MAIARNSDFYFYCTFMGIDGTDGGRELVGGVLVPVGSPLVGGSNWDRWVAMLYLSESNPLGWIG